MTNEPSPRPWSLFVHGEQEGGDGEISIVAEGEWIATMNLRRSTAKADAALIVDSVNNADSWRDAYITARTERNAFLLERDRLRDIVRRLVNQFGNLTSYEDDAAILREARAAIGEGETPNGKGVGR